MAQINSPLTITPLLTEEPNPQYSPPEPATIGHFHIQGSTSADHQVTGFHNSSVTELSPLLSTDNANNSRTLRARLRNLLPSPIVTAHSTFVIKFQPKKESIFVGNPITAQQFEDLDSDKVVSILHKWLDPCCNTGIKAKGCCTILSTIPSVIGTGFFVSCKYSSSSTPTLAAICGFLGISFATMLAAGAGAALIVGCTIYEIGNVLKKIPKTKAEFLLTKLNERISLYEREDLKHPQFPKHLRTAYGTLSLRDPVFIDNFYSAISAREFLWCLSKGKNLPNGSAAKIEELVINELSPLQLRKIDHIKTAFELWDDKKYQLLQEHLDSIQGEECFW